jgi:hypothetical protein
VHFEEDEAVGRSKSQKASSWLKLKLWNSSLSTESRTDSAVWNLRTDLNPNSKIFLMFQLRILIHQCSQQNCSQRLKGWKQPNCLSAGELISKRWYIYICNGVMFSPKKEWDFNTCYSMDERSQVQKGKYCVVLLICGTWNSHVHRDRKYDCGY